MNNITLALAAVVLFINIPFGYWRGGTRKFSFAWFVAIHLPVILSILLRYLAKVRFSIPTLIAFVLAFALGQWLGKHYYLIRVHKSDAIDNMKS